MPDAVESNSGWYYPLVRHYIRVIHCSIKVYFRAKSWLQGELFVVYYYYFLFIGIYLVILRYIKVFNIDLWFFCYYFQQAVAVYWLAIYVPIRGALVHISILNKKLYFIKRPCIRMTANWCSHRRKHLAYIINSLVTYLYYMVLN